jgi:hypothetical protein
MIDEDKDDFFWHALKYRSAAPQHAEQAYQELLACVTRKLEAVKKQCEDIADTMRIPGAIPDTPEAAQDWCAGYIANEIGMLDVKP